MRYFAITVLLSLLGCKAIHSHGSAVNSSGNDSQPQSFNILIEYIPQEAANNIFHILDNPAIRIEVLNGMPGLIVADGAGLPESKIHHLIDQLDRVPGIIHISVSRN